MNHGPHGRLLFEEETFQIRTAIFEVNREMGVGFSPKAEIERLVR